MVALAQVVAWAAVCGTPCQLIKVDLPAGTMFDQLMQIAVDTHTYWLFNFPEVDPHTPVPAIRGTFTVNQAIERILSPTPYSFEWYLKKGQSAFFAVRPLQVCGVPIKVSGDFPTPPCVRTVQR